MGSTRENSVPNIARERWIAITNGRITIKKWFFKRLCCAVMAIATSVTLAVVIVALLMSTTTNQQPTFQPALQSMPHPENYYVIVENAAYETYDPWNRDIAQQNKKPLNALDTYYFPFVGDSNVTFADSLKECSEYKNYALANLDGTNKEFLKRTAQILSNVDADAVWMGGYFKIASRYPYLVYWADISKPRVLDALKSPKDIWCVPPEEVIPSVQEHMEEREYTELILPIVRSKLNSSCLTIHVSDFFSNTQSEFPPLCMLDRNLLTRPVRAEEMPPFFRDVFDEEWERMDMSDLFSKFSTVCDKQHADYTKCMQQQQALDAHYPLRHEHGNLASSKYGFVMVGFPELVSYDYALMICRNAGNLGLWNRKSSTMGLEVLDASESTFISDYKKSFLKAEKTFFKFGSPLTAGHYEFGLTFNDNFTTLLWYAQGSIVPSDPEKMPYNWCIGSDSSSSDPEPAMNLLSKHYDEFKKWRNDVGNKTTDPFFVHVTIDIVRDEPCLRIVTDNLYWPASRLWLPACIIQP